MIEIPVSYDCFKSEVLTKDLQHLKYRVGNVTRLYAIDKSVCFITILPEKYLEDYNSSLLSRENKKLDESVTISPFADKANLNFDGHGSKWLVSPKANTKCVFNIPLGTFKFDAIEIFNSQIGDMVTLNIKMGGTILNTFGTNWNLSQMPMSKKLPYEATLFQGLSICLDYYNYSLDEKFIYANFDLHRIVTK